MVAVGFPRNMLNFSKKGLNSMKELLQRVLSLILDLLFGKQLMISDQLSSYSGTLVASATKQLSEAGLALLPLLNGMSDEEKEYVAKVAFFKSVNTQELTLDEIIEFGEHLNEAVKLGITVQEQHMEFWSRFHDIVKVVTRQFTEITSRSAATALRTIIRV